MWLLYCDTDTVLYGMVSSRSANDPLDAESNDEVDNSKGDKEGWHDPTKSE